MFDLPKSTLIKSVVPKNTFEDYVSPQQRNTLKDKVKRITWMHTLSNDTINLKGEDVKEIQVFYIELKEKVEIPELLLMMNRTILYHIVFVVAYGDELYVSASTKYPHPTNANTDVVSDTATSDWMKQDNVPYKFELVNNLDVVFNRFFLQIKDYVIEDGEHVANERLEEIIKLKNDIEKLEKEIEKVRKRVYNTKQANRQLEYYEELRGLVRQLEIKKRELQRL